VSLNRRRKNGITIPVVEFSCKRCKRKLLTSRAEAQPPKPGLVPYCQDCLKEGQSVVMDRKEYSSGPINLIV